MTTATNNQPLTSDDYDRGYASRSEEAAVRLLRVAGLLQVRTARVLKHYNISPAAHDILCVLRDAGAPLPTRQLNAAISTASPDLTRLLQGMTKRGYVQRTRATHDKRVVLVGLTDEGRAILEQVTGPINSLHKQVFTRLKKGERKDLIKILSDLEDANESRV